MRVANFRVAGDERAECYLTVLGGDGGGLAANVNRWRAQMSQAPAAAAEIEALPRAPFFGRDATFLDVTGTWTGMSGKETDADYELLGFLLVDPAGSIFLKMVGPRAVIGGEIESFDREILSEQRRRDLQILGIAPVLVVLARVCVDRLVRSSMHGAVGLVVAGEVDAAKGNAAGDRMLPDRGGDELTAPLHLAHLADIHRDQAWHRDVGHLAPRRDVVAR